MKIAFYSPDRHIMYDGSTPDCVGVGGGITVRIRMAAALAARGHDVQVVCNCAHRIRYDGVEYTPLDSVEAISAHVIVAHTTGGEIDLTPLTRIRLEADLRVFVLSGTDETKAWEEFHPDLVTVPSDFVAGAVRESWRTHPARMFVCPYGVIPQSPADWPDRDLRSIIYTSHPSKGLAAAIGVIRLLRQRDPAWNLHVFGGNGLWGGCDEPVDEPGVEYLGLTPQSTLHGIYPRFGFAFHLQRRLEPFGLTIVEAMGAGCVAIASPAGAYSEIVENGSNGFLIDGDPETESVQRDAASLIRSVADSPDALARITAAARSTPFCWTTIAEAWETWWRTERGPRAAGMKCAGCDEGLLRTTVGYHCQKCGTYRRYL
jgi:glycosyltransferase involved in cell wall biosynthesis